jgi:hypothetical protein
MKPPGLFFSLVHQGLVSEAELASLIARLPEERYVVASTGLRPGEAFDSTRWPLGRDVALARLAATRLADSSGRVHAMLTELESADAATARRVARSTFARWLAAVGSDTSANIAILKRAWSDATTGDLAVLEEPPWPRDVAETAFQLASVHQFAANGLYAYHAHRRLPGDGAEAAAQLVGRALRASLLTVEELIGAALALL